MSQQPLRPLSQILPELMEALEALSKLRQLDFAQELDLAKRAEQSASEPQMFRAMENLVLTAHATGLTKEPALQQAPAYAEAVQILRMGGKALPKDL